MMPTSVAAGLMRAVASSQSAQLATMRELREYVESLEHRIAELQDIIGINITLPLSLDLTRAESVLLGMLLKTSGIVAAKAFEAALYGALPEADQPDGPGQVIKVHACRVRQKLKPHRIEIGTARGVGYFMTSENKARLRALIDAEAAPCPA